MDYSDDYASWAKDYDLFGEIDNIDEGERHFLDGLLTENNAKSILDCACGTGSHLIMLSKLGYRMAGSDCSDAMLEICRKNLAKENIAVPLKQCDYRKLSEAWLQQFDAVLCLTQAISHMHTKEDLLSALRSMRERLNKGGLLILTQGTTHKTLQEQYRFDLVVNNPAYSRVFSRDIGKEFQTIHILDIFHSEERSGMEIHDIRIKIILDDEFRSLCEAAGFSDVSVWGGYGRQAYDKETSWKLIVAAKA